MNVEDILQNAPRYQDIVTTYGLDVRGGDLQLTPVGNIAVTVDGQDLMWGTTVASVAKQVRETVLTDLLDL